MKPDSAAKVCRFGRHRWLVVEQHSEPSPLERLADKGMTKIGQFSEEMALRSYFVHYRCSKCGTEQVRRA